MNYILQKPLKEDISFEKIINGKKSLVVFVRHLG